MEESRCIFFKDSLTDRFYFQRCDSGDLVLSAYSIVSIEVLYAIPPNPLYNTYIFLMSPTLRWHQRIQLLKTVSEAKNVWDV